MKKKLTLFLRMENVALLFLKRRQTDFLAVWNPLTLVSYQSAEYEFVSQSYNQRKVPFQLGAFERDSFSF